MLGDGSGFMTGTGKIYELMVVIIFGRDMITTPKKKHL